MPKWIKEVYDEFYRHNEIGDLEAVETVLNRINNLLGKAMMDTDDENLYDDIRKELKNVK